MKGLMRVSYSGSAVWRGWRGMGLPREYVGECAGSHSLGGPRKRWIDTVEECLRKGSLDVRQTRRVIRDESEWWGFVNGNT